MANDFNSKDMDEGYRVHNHTDYDRDSSKVIFSKATNLIEQSSYRYSLQERATPNLYRHLFDYDSVPKVSFNHRFVPVQMPDEIWITDTTFRDGQQATQPFTAVHRTIYS